MPGFWSQKLNFFAFTRYLYSQKDGQPTRHIVSENVWLQNLWFQVKYLKNGDQFSKNVYK